MNQRYRYLLDDISLCFCEQSFLLGSHSSLRTDSLGLDLSSTTHSGIGGLGTGREENINFLSDLSDDDGDGSPQVRSICLVCTLQQSFLSLCKYALSLGYC